MNRQKDSGCGVHFKSGLNKADMVASGFVEPNWTDLFAPVQPLCHSVNLRLDQSSASMCIDGMQGIGTSYKESVNSGIESVHGKSMSLFVLDAEFNCPMSKQKRCTSLP